MGRRSCGCCGASLPTDHPRRRWCSDNCRKQIWKWGGPAAALEHHRVWLRATEVMNGRRHPLVGDLRDRIAALRTITKEDA